MTNDSNRPDSSRRSFLRSSAFLGGSAAALGAAPFAGSLIGEAEAATTGTPEYGLGKAENFVHSVCLNCNTGCGVKIKLQDGIA